MKIKVTVYTKNGCPRCRMTKGVMKALSIPFHEINIDKPENNKYRQHLLMNHFMSTPVVKATNGSKVNEWTGFRPEKIHQLANRLK